MSSDKKSFNSSLYDKLVNYSEQKVCPLHMPGHKRNTDLLHENLPYSIDITEIDGFDNLHDSREILKDCADLTAQLFKSKRSFLLVNGSTCGILAGIRAAVKPGDKIIMARNCHKSVYNAVGLNYLKPAYIIPEGDQKSGILGSITPSQIERALNEHPDTKLIVVTSPTYEGVISDISGIAKIAHSKNTPLLVDEAHGSHLGFSPMFKGSALENGADIVINSLHKTLPALTQCALLHLNGDLVDEKCVARELAVFQTSSPSYILLSSIDSCIRLLMKDREKLFSDYENNIKYFDDNIKNLKNLKIICHGKDNIKERSDFYNFDCGKIVISTLGTNLSGSMLSDLMRQKYGIELEMASSDYALAMTSVCDSRENFEKLAYALNEIDKGLKSIPPGSEYAISTSLPRRKEHISRALQLDGTFVPFECAQGHMSLEYIFAYPPGIPVIVPGEIIDGNIEIQLKSLISKGIIPKSTYGKYPGLIYVGD